ncbi:jg10097 [Pararge aegeria aegeria]|uniref:Jg10097 protein n=1 Tax=Pararge aegeria aegeria TaxID=348720 RepID=A0A8S4SGT7_9NEOP|nr:jg10097 [Pararge aegeria aegeria]
MHILIVASLAAAIFKGSLTTKHDEFAVTLQSHSPDILAINETWLKAGEEARAPNIQGYKLIHLPRPTEVSSRGGGVGFYVKRGFRVRKCAHPSGLAEVEQMWISLSINLHNILIGTAYRPPWLDIDKFFDALTDRAGLEKFDGLHKLLRTL